jgi:hypothetical protein
MKIVQPAFKVLPTGRGTAALPVWAYFMKLCYADENLKCESLKDLQIFR